MPRGGPRPGSGRPKGRKDWHLTPDKPLDMKVQPLEFLLMLVGALDAPMALRFAAAKEAAPYVHRKLAPLPVQKEEEAVVPSQDTTVRAWEDDLGDARMN